MIHRFTWILTRLGYPPGRMVEVYGREEERPQVQRTGEFQRKHQTDYGRQRVIPMSELSTAQNTMAHAWEAPTYRGAPGMSARMRIPGSKSLTNRYLLLAALADSPSRLRSPLHSRDSALMISALEALGAQFERIETGSEFGPDLLITPLNLASAPPMVKIDCGLAGTVMRFVPALAALLPGEYNFDGDPQARKRPMAALCDGLRQLGARIERSGNDSVDTLPFTLHSPGLAAASGTPAEIFIDASASSQFVSALLLIAPRLPQGLMIRHRGNAVPSIPHIEMTLQTLRDLGVRAEAVADEYAWRVFPSAIFSGFDVTVEPDLSNAGPFLAAAMVTGNSVTIPDWPAPTADGSPGTTQGGDEWRTILPRLGGAVEFSNGSLTVTGPEDITRLSGVEFNLQTAGELAPTVAALVALLDSPSTLTGIGHLRGHETDRLAALVTEINRLGGLAEETADGIRVLRPVRRLPQDSPVTVQTYEDHRVATFAAVIGLHEPGVRIENVQTTAKTLPQFTALWQKMLSQWKGARS